MARFDFLCPIIADGVNLTSVNGCEKFTIIGCTSSSSSSQFIDDTLHNREILVIDAETPVAMLILYLTHIHSIFKSNFIW